MACPAEGTPSQVIKTVDWGCPAYISLVSALRTDDLQLLAVVNGDVISQEIAERDVVSTVKFESPPSEPA